MGTFSECEIMNATQQEKEIYGEEVQIVSRSSDCVIYRIVDGSGAMEMTSYQVFPGIQLIYNDVHIGKCSIDYGVFGNVMEINHCREGRIECGYREEFFYLTQGDLAISKTGAAGHDSYFPLNHYHGIAIVIDIDRAPACMSCFLDDVNVRPCVLMEKFCRGGKCFVARSKPCLEHIFSELYAVPDSIRKGYFKVKILELLLFLSGMDLSEDQIEKRCFTKTQVGLAKSVCEYLAEHMDSRVTISELADIFHVSQTALKNSFKGVFGVSVYSYIREQKMQAAALMLRQTERSVLEIAGMCGYDNGSKFAGAFRNVMGMTPNEYRNTRNEEEQPQEDT